MKMTKKEALNLIGKRNGWLGVDEHGEYSEYAFYKKRPLTSEAYKLGTPELNEKAAAVIEALNLRGCKGI
jgi:hypothetical protein